MATVRFSANLISDIISNAGTNFEKQKDAAYKVDHSWGTRIYDHVFRDYQHHMAALPKVFFEQCNNFTLESVQPLDLKVDIKFDLPHSYSFPKAYPAGFKWQSNWNNQVVKYIYDSSDPFDIELCEYLTGRNNAIISVRKIEDEFVDSVLKICNSFVTLAPALKAWPPLWDLLPLSAKDKHLEVVERKSSKPELSPDIDIDKMTATIVASKLVR